MAILFCYLLFVHFDKKGVFSRRRQLLEGTPCIAALVKLELKMAKNWTLKCEKNNLIVDIDEEIPPTVKDPNKVKILLYREMANHLSFIAKNSPVANLELIDGILVKMKSENLEKTFCDVATVPPQSPKCPNVKPNPFIMSGFSPV